MLFHLGLALLAGSLLAYELLLLRLFRLAQGSEFTQIAISIALLGFGASGTLLTLARHWAKRRARAISVACAPLAGLAMLGAHFTGQVVPFRPEFLVWGGRHVRDLLLWTLPLCVPFLIGATGLGVVFLRWPHRTRSLCAANLLGSGLGAAGLWGLLCVFTPEDGVLLIASVTALAGGLMVPLRRRGWALALAALFAVGLNAAVHLGLPPVRLSDFRDLARVHLLPGAQTLETLTDPEGRVDVVAAPGLHHAPGESLLASPREHFEQSVICLDGDMGGLLLTARRDTSPMGEEDLARQIESFSAVPWKAATELRPPSSMTFLNGASVLEVLRLRYPSDPPRRRILTLSHPRAAAIALLQEARLRLRGRFIHEVRWVHAAALSALRGLSWPQDLILEISSGGSAVEPDTLHTAEGVCLAIDHIGGGGQLTFALPVDQPPRAALRLVALLAEQARSRWGAAASQHLIALRGFSQIAVTLSPTPWTAEEGANLRRFSRRWAFDLVWAPGLSPEEVNQFNVLDRPVFFDTARRIFAGEAEAVHREYPFDLRPPTAWWPFFWQPFKPATLWGLLIGLRPQGLETVPEVNAVLALVHSIRALATAALVLILLPLLALRGRARGGISRTRTLAHFVALGVGYLAVEILAIFLAERVLGVPVLAATVVLSVFLVLSGLGSLVAWRTRLVFPVLLAAALLSAGALELLARAGLADAARRLWLTALLLAPPAFLMGMPFPRALQALSGRSPALVPWAWGVNGFASVLAPPLALLLALSAGYQAVLLAGLASYALAWATALRPASARAPA